MLKKAVYRYLFLSFCLAAGASLFGGSAWLWAKGSSNKEAAIVSKIQLTRHTMTKLKSRKVVLSALPKQFNLDVPFTSQAPEKNWEEPWQDACEEAVVLMLHAYQKDYALNTTLAKDEMLKMVRWEEKRGWGPSIDAQKIKIMLEEYFGIKRVRRIDNPTVEQIKSLLVQGKPVIVVAAGKLLRNPHYRNGGPTYHALLVRGYTEDSFITNDPGTQFGDNFVYKYSVLMKAMHDWNNGEVLRGNKVVLVVE